jgi:low temperature requirement protein LtrA
VVEQGSHQERDRRLSLPALSRRSRDEPHRVATPLELFFDLCFVVAVSQAANRLHHALAEGDVGFAILHYAMVFFAIWWAWMNFTWHASGYDNDDIPYRLLTFVQIVGALVIAAGVAPAFDDSDFAILVLGYSIMRVGLVTQWLRAAASDPAGRRTALRFAGGISTLMIGWWLILVVPDGWRMWWWLIFAAGELALPLWAERAEPTPWHPHHIAERYGLFTLIVIGESVLAATTAFRVVLDEHDGSGTVYAVATGGLLIIFSMWWLYFSKSADRFLGSNREGFVWGYGHYVVFAAAAAVGAGLVLNVERAVHGVDVHLSRAGAGAAVTVPVALFIAAVWMFQVRPFAIGPLRTALFPLAGALILAGTFAPQPVLAVGIVFAAFMAVSIAIAVDHAEEPGLGGE